MVKKEDTLGKYLKHLISILIVNYVQSMGQNPHLPYQYSMLFLNVKVPQNLSPVRSETDPVKILSQFFNWLANKPGFSSKKQRATLK